MSKMIMDKFVLNGKLQIINDNKTTFDGLVKYVNRDNFIVQVATNQSYFRPILQGEKLEFLVSFELRPFAARQKCCILS